MLRRNKMRNMFTLPLVISLIAVIGISDRSIVTVEGFSIGSRRTALTPSSPSLVKTRQPSSPLISTRSSCYLRLKHGDSADSNDVVHKNGIKKFQGIVKRATNQCTTQLIRFWLKSRRSVLTLCAVLLFWFSAAGTHTPVSHGSSVSSSTARAGVVSRNNIFSSSLDQIVDGYVKGHMFDDDVYDPVESIYREAMDDRLKGTYPKDLKETTSSVLGQNVIKAEKKASGTGFGGALMKTVNFLRRQGLSEMQAIALFTGTFVIGVPLLILGAIAYIAILNKSQVNKLMKQRYGEGYTVDASEKKEEDVDVPDDDDDDDDE